MKKFLNSPQTVLRESLEGFAAAHADLVVLGDQQHFIRRKSLTPGKVALISGGQKRRVHGGSAVTMKNAEAYPEFRGKFAFQPGAHARR